MEEKIELAKSWFIAAQLSIILAGFMFASAGIILSNTANTMNWGLNKVTEVATQNCEDLENVTNYQTIMIGSLDYVQESVESNLKVYKNLSKYGLWLIILSVIFFMVGRHRLKKIKE